MKLEIKTPFVKIDTDEKDCFIDLYYCMGYYENDKFGIKKHTSKAIESAINKIKE